ncbi:MAG: TA0938 family protein [Thermoplasmata archaeon]
MGCALCDSTWGDVWEEVDGDRMFFCCSICVVQFRGLVARIKEETGWPRLDSIEISGDRRGRTCAAKWGEGSFRARVGFTSDGAILRFDAVDSD